MDHCFALLFSLVFLFCKTVAVETGVVRSRPGVRRGRSFQVLFGVLTLIRMFEDLRGRGYEGGYDAVRRYARRWSKEHGEATAAAYVPLIFAPGGAYQFDWSHEVVLLGGVTVIVKVAHVRLHRSRMLAVRVEPVACTPASGW
jgi:hypothetical protein